MSDPATTAPFGTALTMAERRVLAVMATADNEADCAVLLNLSPHTVHAYLRNARSRLGVKTTRQAIAKVSA